MDGEQVNHACETIFSIGETIREAIIDSLQSFEQHSAFETGRGSVTDGLVQLAEATSRVGDAITPVIAPGSDATGGTVGCLTEAVMGLTSGMVAIASAIETLAEAVDLSKP